MFSSPSRLSPTMLRSSPVVTKVSPWELVVSVPPISTSTGFSPLPMLPLGTSSWASPPVETFVPSGLGLESTRSPWGTLRLMSPLLVLLTLSTPKSPYISVISISPGAVAVRLVETSFSLTLMEVKSTSKAISSSPVWGLREIVQLPPSAGISSGTTYSPLTGSVATPSILATVCSIQSC